MPYHEKIRVGVLRGGPSPEYEISLKTGAQVLQHLPERYAPVDIFIDRSGEWHIGGTVHKPHRALIKADVFFNALHGSYGEDGTLQHFLETHAVPFSGSGTLACALSQSKPMAKRILERAGIQTPRSKVLRAEESSGIAALAAAVFRSFPQPSVVKPVRGGSSIATALVQTPFELEVALEEIFRDSGEALIEEYIAGREAACGAIEDFRGQKLYTLLPAEVTLPPESRFHDYYAKYSGAGSFAAPGDFSQSEKEELQDLARQIHTILGLRHYSHSDFIVNPRRGIFFLEVDALPTLTEHSILPHALSAVGSSMPEFLEHVISLALKR